MVPIQETISALNKLFQGENFQRAQTALLQLRPIAEKYNCTLAQLALAWLIAQPQTNAITGFRSVEQAIENAGTFEVELLEEDLDKIDQIGRQATDYLDNNPIMWNW